MHCIEHSQSATRHFTGVPDPSPYRYIINKRESCVKIQRNRKTAEHKQVLKIKLIRTQSRSKGPSIKYVTLFLANFDPPSPVTLCHTSRDPQKVRHTSRTPPIFSRPSTKIPDKSPLYKFYREGFCLGGFVRVGSCPSPLMSQYICYNRKLNITLNFMFHMSSD